MNNQMVGFTNRVDKPMVEGEYGITSEKFRPAKAAE